MRKIIFVITCFIVASCVNNSQKSQNESLFTAKIDVSKVGTLEYNNHFESMLLIPLETLEESLVGEIGKLIVSDSVIIIFDTKDNSILTFEMSGKFIRRIGKKGNGPGEYIYLNDINFDDKTSLIYAHERYQNRIFTYNLAGELMNKSEESKYSFDSFYKTDQGYWVYSCYSQNNPDRYSLQLLDDKLQSAKASFFPHKEFLSVTSSSKFTSDENGSVYFTNPTSNVIYQLEGENAIPYCTIDFGDKTMPYDEITKLSDSKIYEELVADRKYLGDIENVKVNNGKIYCSFKESGLNISAKSYGCIVNIKDQNTFIYNNPFIDGVNLPILSNPLTFFDSTFLFPMFPYNLTPDSYPTINERFGISIDGESNPVLCLLKLK